MRMVLFRIVRRKNPKPQPGPIFNFIYNDLRIMFEYQLPVFDILHVQSGLHGRRNLWKLLVDQSNVQFKLVLQLLECSLCHTLRKNLCLRFILHGHSSFEFVDDIPGPHMLANWMNWYSRYIAMLLVDNNMRDGLKKKPTAAHHYQATCWQSNYLELPFLLAMMVELLLTFQ